MTPPKLHRCPGSPRVHDQPRHRSRLADRSPAEPACQVIARPLSPSGAATAISKVALRQRRYHRRPGQIPIDLDAPRDFLPWRFSDAGRSGVQPHTSCRRPTNLHIFGSRDPSAMSKTVSLIRTSTGSHWARLHPLGLVGAPGLSEQCSIVSKLAATSGCSGPRPPYSYRQRSLKERLGFGVVVLGKVDLPWFSGEPLSRFSRRPRTGKGLYTPTRNPTWTTDTSTPRHKVSYEQG